MTYTPRSLYDLGTLWARSGGVNLGIVGNQRHTAGYHLGHDRIYSQCAAKPDGTCVPGRYAKDYSVTNARDRAGLTDAASAIDLGKLAGSYDNLYAFSMWLVRQCQAKAAGYRDVREVIYSPDGIKVQRYSGIDGKIHTGAGNGDLSHRTHTHISYFRDSEKRDKRRLFEPYFIPDTSTPEAPVISPGDDFNFGLESWTIDAGKPTERTVYSIGAPRLPDGESDPLMRLIPAGPGSKVMTVVSRARLTNGKQLDSSDALYAALTAGKLPAAPLPDCTAAVAAQREKDRTAVLAAVAAALP